MNQKRKQTMSYPDILRQLPEARMSVEGARAWIMQGQNNQVVFFEFEANIDLPDHNHTYPQWGMVIEGEMELRVDGKPRICKKGDEYLTCPSNARCPIHKENPCHGLFLGEKQIHTKIEQVFKFEITVSILDRIEI